MRKADKEWMICWTCAHVTCWRSGPDETTSGVCRRIKRRKVVGMEDTCKYWKQRTKPKLEYL